MIILIPAASGIKGCHLLVNSIGVVVVEIDRTWQVVVRSALVKLSGTASLDEIYGQVESAAGEKVRKNPNYKAKIRQILQRHFTRIERGIYGTVYAPDYFHQRKLRAKKRPPEFMKGTATIER